MDRFKFQTNNIVDNAKRSLIFVAERPRHSRLGTEERDDIEKMEVAEANLSLSNASSPSNLYNIEEERTLIHTPEELPNNASVIEKYLFFMINQNTTELLDLVSDDFMFIIYGRSVIDGIVKGKEDFLQQIQFTFSYCIPMLAKVFRQSFVSPSRISTKISQMALLSDGSYHIETLPLASTVRVCPDGKVRMLTLEFDRHGIKDPLILSSNVFLKSSRMANKTIRIVTESSSVGSLLASEENEHSKTVLAPLYITDQ